MELHARHFWLAFVFLGVSSVASTGPRPKLRFRQDSTFTIAQFTDLHYGTTPGDPEADRRSDQVW